MKLWEMTFEEIKQAVRTLEPSQPIPSKIVCGSDEAYQLMKQKFFVAGGIPEPKIGLALFGIPVSVSTDIPQDEIHIMDSAGNLDSKMKVKTDSWAPPLEVRR